MRGRVRSTGAGAAAVLLALSLLVGCEEKDPEGAQEETAKAAASDAGNGQVPTAAAPAASAPAAKSTTAVSAAPQAGGTGERTWCEVDEIDRIVMRSDDSVPCSEVEKTFSKAAEWEFSDDPEAGAAAGGASCSIAAGLVSGEHSDFTDVAMCRIGDTVLVALAPESVPLDGYIVEMGEYGTSQASGMEYGFSVPDSRMVCSIVSDEEGGRGLVGCQGDFDPEAKVERDSGDWVQAQTVVLDEEGADFVDYGDLRFHPDGQADGDDWSEGIPVLPVGRVISAYGIVCMGHEKGAVECTAGPGKRMRISPTEHELGG